MVGTLCPEIWKNLLTDSVLPMTEAILSLEIPSNYLWMPTAKLTQPALQLGVAM